MHADDLEFEGESPPQRAELIALFAQTSWAASRTEVDVAKMLRSDAVWVTARDQGRLIGVGRAISDGVYRALIDDVVVDAAYRGQGVGSRILSELLLQLDGVEEVFLHTRDHLRGFYERSGYVPFTGITMLWRTASPVQHQGESES